jgi:Zn-dependent protease/CBS domain-containing protein
MNASFQLGRIRGISIGINWSLLLIFALIAWTLADGVFPRQNPGLGSGTYIGMAIVAATLFFASILAHELGHAFVAQHEGMEIQGITLWLFGGVARFRGEFQSAKSEFWIAIAGPAVSLVIGLAAVGIARLGLPPAIDGVASWLGYINLLLLVFNLLPALPLDGGRIFRSILWHAKKDFVWATRVAARTGQLIGALIVAAGIVLIVLEGAFGGAWLAVVGWFVLTAAGDERRAADRKQLFGDLRVGELMVRDPITVPPDATVEQLVDAMTAEIEHAAYPVVEGERAVGLFPLARILQAPKEQWAGRRVRDFALPLASVPVLRAETPLAEATGRLSEGGLGRGLVLDGDRLVGLLTLSDVASGLRARGIPAPQ